MHYSKEEKLLIETTGDVGMQLRDHLDTLNVMEAKAFLEEVVLLARQTSQIVEEVAPLVDAKLVRKEVTIDADSDLEPGLQRTIKIVDEVESAKLTFS
jgi:urease gamma subunit